MLRRSVGTGLLGLGILTLTGNAQAATPTSDNSFTPAGQHISLTGGGAKNLDPGLYAANLPVDSSTNTFSVTKPAGESVQVSVVGSARWNGQQGGSAQTLTLSLRTPSGATCATSSSSTSNTEQPNVLATTVAFDATDTSRNSAGSGSALAECMRATNLRVGIQATKTGDVPNALPAQIAVQRRPALSGSSGSGTDTGGTASSATPMTTTAITPSRTVTPGTGFAQATTLTPGGYSLNASPNSLMFFRVHLGWGQRLSIGWRLPGLGDSYSPITLMSAKLSLFSPALAPATIPADMQPSGFVVPSVATPVTLGANTVTIADSNAATPPSGVPAAAAQAQNEPGWYYVVLNLSPQASNITGLSAAPTTLSVRVSGAATSAPALSVAQPAAGMLSGQPSSHHKSSGSSATGWLSALGGVAVLGVCAVALSRFLNSRKRRRAGRAD